jgi:hypothetical protein
VGILSHRLSYLRGFWQQFVQIRSRNCVIVEFQIAVQSQKRVEKCSFMCSISGGAALAAHELSTWRLCINSVSPNDGVNKFQMDWHQLTYEDPLRT